MPRSYRQIKEYENEILKLKAQGYTLREIGAKYGFTYEQIHNFLSRYNINQRKVSAGIVLKKKGRPPKDYVVSTECIYRVKLQTYEEARLLIDEYIYFYNNQRIQLKTKLTPLEKRSQYVA